MEWDLKMRKAGVCTGWMARSAFMSSSSTRSALLGFGGTFYGSRLFALGLTICFALLAIYSYLRQSPAAVTAAVTRGISSKKTIMNSKSHQTNNEQYAKGQITVPPCYPSE